MQASTRWSDPPSGRPPRTRSAGTAELEAAADRNPADPQAPSLLLIVHRVREDWPAARDLLASPRGRMVDPGTVLAVQTVAFQSGASRESAEIGEAFLQGHPAAAGDVPALIAYNAACGWAKAGELPRGLQAFRRAADLGFRDLTSVDSDEDIAPLRPLPGYDEARQQIRQRALATVDESPR